MNHTIDATDKSLGRIASEAAHILLGKHSPSFAKNKVSSDKVEIINAAKTKMTDKKASEKEYPKYSGYPGGLRFERLDKVIKEKGYTEVYTRAVKRMLPSNRLRDLRLKNLIVTE